MALSTGHFSTEQALEEILTASQHRWLRPAEILEIFGNYQKLGILISEPQERPPSGQFFIIKRHLLRLFRKDGHNWKKKDGKTVQEAHEQLKVEGVPMLQCYYAHVEENEDFQRRLYWMLKGEPSDIVLLHYLEAKRIKRCKREREIVLGELPASSFNDCLERMIFQPILEWQDPVANFSDITSENLHKRFEELLCLSSVRPDRNNLSEVLRLSKEIKPLLKAEDEWDQMSVLFSEMKISPNIAEEKFRQKFLKEKLFLWLLQKVAEDRRALTLLDQGGQGVLHFAAALGYDWALKATVAAGVDINFRDINGWTALHWAAYCLRGETVLLLTENDADIEAQSSYPYGKTPAALAYDVGGTHIADFLKFRSEPSNYYQLIGAAADFSPPSI